MIEPPVPPALPATSPMNGAPGHNGPLLVDESRLTRSLGVILALVVTGLFFWINLTYMVEAHGGVDQNGYLFGGKIFQQQFTQGYIPRHPATGELDPFSFVGRMWVGADLGTTDERFYPKYPLGLPAMVALLLTLFGPHDGAAWSFWISPICMTLAVLGTFFLARLIIGSFLALLATIVVATSPVTLGLSTNPNSHASTLFFVVWGLAMLLAWWRWGGLWRGIIAGLLLGYALTIRYSEGLLLLPLFLCVLFNLHWRQWRSWLQSGLVLASWALPGVLLVSYNLLAFGAFTGYDPTSESTGFAWTYFADNWETMLRHLNTTGLVFLFPLGLVGMVLLYGSHARLALVITSWIVPNLLIYTAYYWAPDGPGSIGYLRFFLTVFPGLALCAFFIFAPHPTGSWVKKAVGSSTDAQGSDSVTGKNHSVLPTFALVPRPVAAIAAGLITALAITFQWQAAQPALVSDYVNRQTLVQGRDAVWANVPDESVIFSSDQSLLHYLQFVGNYHLYSPEVFTYPFVLRLNRFDPDEPQPWHAQRQQQLLDTFLKVGVQLPEPNVPTNEVPREQRDARAKFDRDQQKLLDEQRWALMQSSLQAGHRVFVILPQRAQADLRRMVPGNAPVQVALEGKPVATFQNTWPNPIPPRRFAPGPQRPPRRQDAAPPRVDLRSNFYFIYEITAKPER